MAGRSLRAHLLRMLLPLIAAVLALGALVTYFPAIEPATHAYDQALVDIGLALGSHVRVTQTEYTFELPPAVEQVLRTDRFDAIYYRVMSPPAWRSRATGAAGAAQRRDRARHDVQRRQGARGRCSRRAAARRARCWSAKPWKRERLARELVLQSILPELFIAIATLLIVWFGVKRGLRPLARLSEEIKSRSAGDLRRSTPLARRKKRGRWWARSTACLTKSRPRAASSSALADAAHQLRTPPPACARTPSSRSRSRCRSVARAGRAGASGDDPHARLAN